MSKRVVRNIRFLLAGGLVGAVLSVVAHFTGIISSADEASAQEAANLPEAAVERLPEAGEEPLDDLPLPADAAPTAVATAELDNHVRAVQEAINPDAYRIEISKSILNSDVEINFDDVRAAVAKIPVGTALPDEHGPHESSWVSGTIEPDMFLNLSVGIQRDDRATEVEIRYHTPKPILQEDVDLLTALLSGLEKQLSLSR